MDRGPGKKEVQRLLSTDDSEELTEVRLVSRYNHKVGMGYLQFLTSVAPACKVMESPPG